MGLNPQSPLKAPSVWCQHRDPNNPQTHSSTIVHVIPFLFCFKGPTFPPIPHSSRWTQQLRTRVINCSPKTHDGRFRNSLGFFFSHICLKKKSPGKTFYEGEAMVAAIDDQFMWSKLTNSLVSPLFTSHDIQDTIFPSIH